MSKGPEAGAWGPRAGIQRAGGQHPGGQGLVPGVAQGWCPGVPGAGSWRARGWQLGGWELASRGPEAGVQGPGASSGLLGAALLLLANAGAISPSS